MPRNYNVKTAIEGAIYDANAKLYEGNVRKAHQILKKKMDEISRLEKADWITLEWE